MSEYEESARNMIAAAVKQGFNIDMRGKCVYMTKENNTIYLDWSIPSDGIIIDSWTD
jgi:hypothetical protein